MLLKFINTYSIWVIRIRVCICVYYSATSKIVEGFLWIKINTKVCFRMPVSIRISSESRKAFLFVSCITNLMCFVLKLYSHFRDFCAWNFSEPRVHGGTIGPHIALRSKWLTRMLRLSHVKEGQSWLSLSMLPILLSRCLFWSKLRSLPGPAPHGINRACYCKSQPQATL